VAEGYKPQFIQYVDPYESAIEFRLEARPAEDPEPERVARGRILAPSGAPVVGATVSPYGVRVGESQRFGGLEDIDPLVITDAEGRFALVSPVPLDGFFVDIRARGLAPVTLELATGEMDHEIDLSNGVAVAGRLVKAGEPVAGVLMGLVQQEHRAGTFVGEFTIGTDDEGRFLFPNVSPDEKYFVYGKLETLVGTGAVQVSGVEVSGHDTQLDVGTLEVTPGLELSGRVFLSDDQPLPAGTRLLIGREAAWDTCSVLLEADGSFTVTNLPPEQITLNVRLRGYRFSTENYSLDLLNPFSLIGWIREDIDDLEILLEPGALDPGGRPSNEALQEFFKRREEALAGMSPAGR
jgi:hypothetical protein